MNLHTRIEGPIAHPYAGTARLPRSLQAALALSLLAHLLLLWPSPPLLVRPRLAATLRAAAETPVSAHLVPAQGAATTALAQPRPLAASRASPPPRPLPVARPREVPPPALPADAAAHEVAEPRVAVDADSLRSYRIALALNARRFHAYPEPAIVARQAGTVQLRVEVAEQGAAGRVAVMRSSGHDLLDRQAQDMVARAAVATSLPGPLRGHAFAVDLPVEFVLPAN